MGFGDRGACGHDTRSSQDFWERITCSQRDDVEIKRGFFSARGHCHFLMWSRSCYSNLLTGNEARELPCKEMQESGNHVLEDIIELLIILHLGPFLFLFCLPAMREKISPCSVRLLKQIQGQFIPASVTLPLLLAVAHHTENQRQNYLYFPLVLFKSCQK